VSGGVSGGVSGFDAGLRRVEDALAAAAAIALLALAGMVVLGVVLRYLFASPLSWAYAFTTDYLLVAVFFLALPFTVRAGAHVRIDMLYRTLSRRAQRWCDVVGAVLSVLFAAALTWGGIVLTTGAWADGDVPPPGGSELSWPVWTSTIMVPIGSAVLLVRLLHDLVVRPTETPAEPVAPEAST
jgi:TRAP-type C4-dicarboxylate transport system permease small subunit